MPGTLNRDIVCQISPITRASFPKISSLRVRWVPNIDEPDQQIHKCFIVRLNRLHRPTSGKFIIFSVALFEVRLHSSGTSLRLRTESVVGPPTSSDLIQLGILKGQNIFKVVSWEICSHPAVQRASLRLSLSLSLSLYLSLSLSLYLSLSLSLSLARSLARSLTHCPFSESPLS